MASKSPGPARTATELVGIGWDVRGWQSRAQSVAVATFDATGVAWQGLAPAFAFETGQRPGPAQLFSATGDGELAARIERADSVVVAIDAPLAFPRALVRLIDGQAGPRRRASEIENPLAYRDCDRWVAATHGKKPLSAAFDRLGNPATLAMTVCGGLRDGGFGVVPFDGESARKCVIEVYPGLHKRGPARSDTAIETLGRHLPTGIEAGTDLYDACLCALLGLVYAGAELGVPPLVGPEPGLDADEGWIYALPADYVARARRPA